MEAKNLIKLIIYQNDIYEKNQDYLYILCACEAFWLSNGLWIVTIIFTTHQLKNELEICCNCEQKTLLQKICVKNF